MKKLSFLFLFVFLFSGFIVHAQITAVIAAVTDTILETTHLDQVIHYAQQVKEWVETATRFQQQIAHWKFQVERSMKNLTSLGDIQSYSDFMKWYNRQLYYERSAAASFEKANISIGGKKYSLYDLEGIANAVDDTYVDYWNQEFTDQQRKEMWRGLGLTPSNYAYVQSFKEKAGNLSREMFFATDIQNDWYARNMERNNERQNRMSDDKKLDADDPDKLTEKELLMMAVESLQETNKVTNDIAYNQALQMELQAAKNYLEQTPYDAPLLADWPEDGFVALDDDSI